MYIKGIQERESKKGYKERGEKTLKLSYKQE